MSGKYLHGLIIDSDFVNVKDNIFSHSELRQEWTGEEGKHNLIQEWSWDYVTREFAETYKELIPIAQKWIKKNISTHKQLIAWVDRNWGGLVCGDESEREFYVWQLIDEKAKCKNKLVNNFLKACADWAKACADWAKACADWNKACADWNKACADWAKAGADWKTRIMKPVFMELLKKYPNKHWRNK